MTMSCICVAFEKQMVLRTKRLIRFRNVRYVRSIFWVFRLPGLCTSASRCRVYAPPMIGGLQIQDDFFQDLAAPPMSSLHAFTLSMKVAYRSHVGRDNAQC